MLESINVDKILGEVELQIDVRPTSLMELENETKQFVCQVGRQMMQKWLKRNEESDPSPTTRCRECAKEARYVNKRVGYARTQFGVIRYRRAYYVCPHCEKSTYPLDERLNPYTSLARLRTKIAAGKSLPVNKLAKAWGLGTLKGPKYEGGKSNGSPIP